MTQFCYFKRDLRQLKHLRLKIFLTFFEGFEFFETHFLIKKRVQD